MLYGNGAALPRGPRHIFLDSRAQKDYAMRIGTPTTGKENPMGDKGGKKDKDKAKKQQDKKAVDKTKKKDDAKPKKA